MILKLATKTGMHTKQFDVKTAFLYGELDEDVYMEQPASLENGTSKVSQLNKSLYGLKQAPRRWNKRLIDCLQRFDLHPTEADTCVFESPGDLNNCLILAVYVDDAIVISKDNNEIEKLLEHLKKELEIKVTNLNMFSGIQLIKEPDGSIIAHQALYTQKLLKTLKMELASPVSIPSDNNQDLSLLTISTTEETCSVNTPYREAVGSLLFLSMTTRPDITFTVNNVSKFCSQPQKVDWNAVKRILKYLKGTINMGIKFSTNLIWLDMLMQILLVTK